ncbi:MAG: hypothetical protein ACFB0E_18910 [Leptolyngbyaceae cyanobacterium]
MNTPLLVSVPSSFFEAALLRPADFESRRGRADFQSILAGIDNSLSAPSSVSPQIAAT